MRLGAQKTGNIASLFNLKLIIFFSSSALAFLLGLPVSQMIFFCVAIGHYPVGLPIAVVNYEVNSTDTLCDYNKNVCPQDPNTYEWNLTRFSCEYLDFLSKRQSNLVSDCFFT